MNERIKELAEQADQYARSDNSAMLFENFQKRYTEKFAELIVRECAGVAWGIYANQEIANGIKQHFGVE